MNTSEENLTDKCSKTLIVLEEMEKVGKKQPDLTELLIYNFMKTGASLDEEVYKYRDEMYGHKKIEDEEEREDSEDEEVL